MCQVLLDKNRKITKICPSKKGAFFVMKVFTFPISKGIGKLEPN